MAEGVLPPTTHDPRAIPPEKLRQVYKRYQKLQVDQLEYEIDILDLAKTNKYKGRARLKSLEAVSAKDVLSASCDFLARSLERSPNAHLSRFEIEGLPGLHVIPSALSSEVQIGLLTRLLHRDLSDHRHQTNLHKHYNISYCSSLGQDPHALEESRRCGRPNSGHWAVDDVGRTGSFFALAPTRADFCLPQDPTVHKALTTSQFLGRKLRWMTLGGQYDWTDKVYPSGPPPPFPSDIGRLLRGLFPETDCQAAIVNLYSPGDTLSLHRDVSEESSRGLISVSIGCDAIFVVGLEEKRHDGLDIDERNTDNVQHIAIRLHSGDAVYMSGPARFAWHGVPKIIAGSCPEWMRDWPARPTGVGAGVDDFEAWRGWMAGKRINLNVRQMFDSEG